MSLLIADLCCGAGGAAMGISRALPCAHIVGFDVRPQPHYPFDFQLADALAVDLANFDFVWASPPCQRYSCATNGQASRRDRYPNLLPHLLEKVIHSGVPYIFENVVQSPLPRHVVLCGQMFGLPIYRHRAFASSSLLLAPFHLSHTGPPGMTVAGNWNGTLAAASTAMGISWMNRHELAQAVPPAYSEYLVRQVMSER